MGFLSCWSFLLDIIHIDKHLSTVPETETRICALPDDLLLQILHYVPTKDAVATSILSKRWRFVWTMLPELNFKDEGSESAGWFIEKSLQLHKAPKLKSLIVELGPRCPSDVDIGNWVENAVNRGVKVLDFKLLWTGKATKFPKCLYSCDTLYDLTLSNQILVDVSSPARLPSLVNLSLVDVVYKDEDSLLRLLSSSPVLKWLRVRRFRDDNLTNFTVKVASLIALRYEEDEEDEEDELEDDDLVEVEEDDVDEVVGDELEENEVEDDDVDEAEEDNIDEVEDDDVDEIEEDNLDEVEDDDVDEIEDDDGLNGSLVIDSPALTSLYLANIWSYCLVENMSCLDTAHIGYIDNPDDKFLRSLSSVTRLNLWFTRSMVAWCNAIKFPRLRYFYFLPYCLVDWLETLTFLLQNSPKLKSLTIDTKLSGCIEPSWNQPSSIPGCLSFHLEIFRWRGYQGREDKKQLMTYILANSKFLKSVEIYLLKACDLEERQKEIESMPRISTSSQLLISTQMDIRFNE